MFGDMTGGFVAAFPHAVSGFRPLKKSRHQPSTGPSEGEIKMMRLQKFVEKGSYGEGPGRTAYALDSSSLPSAADGMDWQKVDSFKAAAEILNDPGLKEVFKTVIEKGCAIVAEPPVTG
jgi:hypothetical protein